MYLKMYIGKLLVDQIELDYTEMKTAMARQSYQERLAAELFQLHIWKIKQCMLMPKFFVDQVPSAVNELTGWEIDQIPRSQY